MNTGTNPAEPQGPVAPVIKWVPREEDPETNNKIIVTHVAFKGAQMGSIIASVVQAAIYRTRLMAGLAPFFVGNLAITGVSTVITTAAGYYIVKTSEPIRNFDRAFRLTNNSVQSRCDKYSVMFGGAGVVIGVMYTFPWTRLVQPYQLARTLGTGTFGMGFGTIMHYLTSAGPGHADPINMWRG